MYPLIQEEGNEVVIQFSSNSVDHQPYKDLILHHSHSSLLHNKNSSSNNNNNKVAHRDIERQRRKQMATLHASLRSLLPLHFIKGKRSISDQIKEAMNYINQLQSNVKELTSKRDKLKKLSSFALQLNNIIGADNDEEMIEITCCCSYTRDREEQVVPLSKLLQLVLQEGIHVVTSLSTQLNNATLIHTLHCQVKSNNSVNLSELRTKLINEISSIISFRCHL